MSFPQARLVFVACPPVSHGGADLDREVSIIRSSRVLEIQGLVRDGPSIFCTLPLEILLCGSA